MNTMPLRPKQDRDAGLPQEKDAMGRFVTAYDPHMALLIVERIAMGETLIQILDGQKGMPARSTFHRWVVNNPELARAYNAARQLSAQTLEEKALDLAEIASNAKKHNLTGTDVRGLEVAMNQFRWSAIRRDPEKYAEKTQHTVTVPVQINTMLDLGGNAGGVSTAEHPNIYSLSARVDVEAPDDPDATILPEVSPTGKHILRPRAPQDTLMLAKPRPRRKKNAEIPAEPAPSPDVEG